jgi:hypothetical protein
MGDAGGDFAIVTPGIVHNLGLSRGDDCCCVTSPDCKIIFVKLVFKAPSESLLEEEEFSCATDNCEHLTSVRIEHGSGNLKKNPGLVKRIVL